MSAEAPEPIDLGYDNQDVKSIPRSSKEAVAYLKTEDPELTLEQMEMFEKSRIWEGDAAVLAADLELDINDPEVQALVEDALQRAEEFYESEKAVVMPKIRSMEKTSKVLYVAFQLARAASGTAKTAR